MDLGNSSMYMDRSQHSDQLLQMLNTCYQRHLLTDLIIVTEPNKKETAVHKVVMATFCSHFRERLEANNWNESKLILADADDVILSVLLDFLYTGHMELTQDSVDAVRSLAEQLGVPTAVDYCDRYLKSEVMNKISTAEVKNEPSSLSEVSGSEEINKNCTPERRSARISSFLSSKKGDHKAVNQHGINDRSSRKKIKRTATKKPTAALSEGHISRGEEIVSTESAPFSVDMKGTEKAMTVPARISLNDSPVKQFVHKRAISMSKLHHCRVCKKAFIYSSQQQLHERIHGWLPYSTKVSHLLTCHQIIQFCRMATKVGSGSNARCFVDRDVRAASSMTRHQFFISSIHKYSANPLPAENCTDHKMKNEQQNTAMSRLSEQAGQCLGIPSDVDDNDRLHSANDEVSGIPKASGSPECVVRSKAYKTKVCTYAFNQKKYHCLLCEKQFSLYVLLKAHLLNSHFRKWSCPRCGGCFWSAKLLRVHQRLQSLEKTSGPGGKLLKCGQCGNRFRFRGSLRRHTERADHRIRSVRLLCCGNCRISFKDMASFCRHPCYTHMYTVLEKKHRIYCKQRLVTRLVVSKVKQSPRVTKAHKCADEYLCKSCGATFSSRYHGRLHIQIRHQGSALHERLWQQRRRRRQRQELFCEQPGCDFASTNAMKLASHVEARHPNVLHQCDKCSFSTPLLHKLSQHLCREHGVGKICEVCGKSFRKRLQLRIHRVSKHDLLDPCLKPIRCSVKDCDYVTYDKGLIRQHARKHSDDNVWSCPYCGRKLKQEKYLTKHINKVHMGIRPFICDQCGANYGEESELKSHMARHDTVARFHCEHCSYATQDKGNLKSHMWSRHKLLLNKNQKLFSCDVCDYRCDRKTRFTDHLNTHKQVRQFGCKVCSRMFLTKSTLEGHLKVVHSDTEVQCSFCQFKTKSRYNLKNHVRVMHTHRHVKPFCCPYCEFRCATSGNCRKHVMNRHKGLPVRWIRADGGEAVKADFEMETGQQQQQQQQQQQPQNQAVWQEQQGNLSAVLDRGRSGDKVLATDITLAENGQQAGGSRTGAALPPVTNPEEAAFASIQHTEQAKDVDPVTSQSEQLGEASPKSLCFYLYLTDQSLQT